MVVQDKGVPSLSSSSTVRIDITDVNDQIPAFSELFSTFDIPENTGSGTVAALAYSDRDSAAVNGGSTVAITSVEPDTSELSILAYHELVIMKCFFSQFLAYSV